MLPVSSSNSVKIISLNRGDLLARLRQIAARLKAEHPAVDQVRLFGSLARGDATGMSDVDILILLRRALESDPHRRILTFLPYFDLPRSIDVLVYTLAELEQRLSQNDPFMQRVWNESIPL